MEQQRNIPQLRFTEFTEAWEKKKSGEVAEIFDGTHQTPKYVSKGVKFVSVENIQNIYETEKFITPEAFEKEYKIKPKKNDILMTRITAGIIGDTAVVENNEPLGFYVSLALLRLKEGTATNFMVQRIASTQFKNELHKRIIHVAFPKKINLGDIQECEVSFPSLPEQTKIATFLTTVDEKLQALKKKQSLLEQYKKGIMQKLFSQELRFKDEQGKDFPDWEVKKLDDVMVEKNILQPKSKKYPLMAFVANKGVASKGDRYNREFLVSDEENKKYKQTDIGDFIYSSNNLETGSIGLNNYGAASISPVYSIFEVKHGFYSKFIEFYFTRKEFIGKMIKYRQGVVYGQWRIHESEFLNITEQLPCLGEQTKIAQFLSALDEKINQAKTQISQTETWKKGLLQQMFC